MRQQVASRLVWRVPKSTLCERRDSFSSQPNDDLLGIYAKNLSISRRSASLAGPVALREKQKEHFVTVHLLRVNVD